MAGGGWAVPGRGDPPWDWHRFREVGVSEPDNKLRLRTIGSIGHATGMGGTSFNDRRFLVLRDLEATDVEIAAQFLTTTGAQFGLGARVGPDRAVAVWHNVYYRGSARVLQGIWRYDGANLHSTNQQEGHTAGFGWVALGAVGDGTMVTVTTAEPHHLVRGDLVDHGGGMSDLGMAFVHDAPGPNTYTLELPLEGVWGAGTWQDLAAEVPRWLALRLTGTRISFKQWLPREVEPSWDDPERTVVNELPPVLDDGQPVPTQAGRHRPDARAPRPRRPHRAAGPARHPARLSGARRPRTAGPADTRSVTGHARCARASRP